MPKRANRCQEQPKHLIAPCTEPAPIGEVPSIPCPRRDYQDDFPSGAPLLALERRVMLAMKIGDVIRSYDALGNFEAMVRRWDAIRDQWTAEVVAHQKRWDEHCERVYRDPQLRNKKAKPPVRGWRFGPLRWDKRVEGVLYGWMPPDFLVENTPDNPLPLPVPERQVLLEEKYAALAAIYDHDSKGVKKIDPWKNTPADSFEGIGYHHTLVSLVAGLDEHDEAPLWGWLKDLEQDLRTIRPAPFPPIVDTPAHLRDGGLRKQLATLEQAIVQVSEHVQTAVRSLRAPNRVPPSDLRAAKTAAKRSAPNSTAAAETVPNPSAPFSLTYIAEAWGGQMTAKKLRPVIGGSVRGRRLNRQTWIVCLDDVTVAARKKLAPAPPISPPLTPTEKTHLGNH
jgi:hypothetical protein